MSQAQRGPGWWQASDGEWYPPESHSDPAYRDAHAPTAIDVGSFVTYPTRLAVRRSPEIARWRALAHPFMAIPHLITASVISALAAVALVAAWFTILATERLPEGMHNFIAMTLRYAARVIGFTILMTDQYPRFDFALTARDPGSHAVTVDIDYETHPRNRMTVFFHGLMVVPQAMVLTVLGLVAALAYLAGCVAVLVTGRMPAAVGDVLVGQGRWFARVAAYCGLLTDEYPPFSAR